MAKQRITRGVALVGDIKVTGAGAGALQHFASGIIARTNTTAKNLFILPVGAIIIDVRLYVPVASNAGTTATVSVGISGTPGAYLNTQDVKGAGIGIVNTGSSTVLGSVGPNAVTVQGIYAESGGASTVGGPFSVFLDYITP